jgi:hypothetical protein
VGTSIAGWGQLQLRVPHHPFPTNYIVAATIDQLVEPATTQGCAGIAVHTSADGTTADTVQVCDFGSKASAYLIGVRGSEVSRIAQDVPRNAGVFTVHAEVTAQSLLWTVNGVRLPAAQAVASTTTFVGLDMFWQHAGAHARFSNFSFTPE